MARPCSVSPAPRPEPDRCAGALHRVLGHAGRVGHRRPGVTYCIEPLSPAETPVVNTVAQAAAVVDAIGSPALRTMLDLSAASQRRDRRRGHACCVAGCPAATSPMCSSTTTTAAAPARATRRCSRRCCGAAGARLPRLAGDRTLRLPPRRRQPAPRSASAMCAACWRPCDDGRPASACAGSNCSSGRCVLRLPFRFGAATVTRCPQAFVRVVAEIDGRGATGASGRADGAEVVRQVAQR